MRVEINGKVTTFDVKSVGKYEDFEKQCEGLSTFKQLPKKQRKAKIKEVYGDISGVSKKSSKSGKSVRKDIHGHDNEPDRGNIGTEQAATSGREDIKGKEDKTEVQGSKLRKEKEKDES